ncbi:MAG: hypothetical protein J6A56_01830 [Clostridia bacterium]|nr:hypothetical protein [Clostridia bacterium]
MKKLILILVVLAMVASAFWMPAFARSGDIAGLYYGTDIKTFLNGVEISAINIGGETLISGEDMVYYSFSVWWDGQARTLRIDEAELASNGIPPAVVSPQVPSGTPLGYYFETDIITYLDNVPITAYNIGGRTYIHAEEMRKFGYLVDWHPEERTLKITSPIRAGYVYKFGMSYGEDKGWGAGNPGVDGIGVCSVTYTPDGLIGTDDADYFDLTMYSTGRGYQFDMVFYQNKALFNSALLQDKLRPLCYAGYGVEVSCDKSEKYELVNQTVFISINGYKAEKVGVLSGAGNGHRDFYFEAEGLPKFTKDEIQEVVFSVGDSNGEPYEIVVPEYVTNGPDQIAESLKKNPTDSVVTYHYLDKGYVIYMKESAQLGVVKDRLYLYNSSTKEVSGDVLEQVRTLPEFNYDVIQPFSFRTGEDGTNFFFACSSPEKTMNFYVNLDTHKVYDMDGNTITNL